MEKIWFKTKFLMGSAILCMVIYWLFWGRILSIETGDNNLNELVDLSYFELLHPDMSRSEVTEKMGQPTKEEVMYVEKEYGKIVYAEVRWTYEKPTGLLGYYVAEEDMPEGSVEYIPKEMYVDDFLVENHQSLFGKKFIEINSDNKHLMTISLGRNKKIKKINWYYEDHTK